MTDYKLQADSQQMERGEGGFIEMEEILLKLKAWKWNFHF
jgi:hypothetical protein